MPMHAEQVTIHRVENGWLMHVHCAGTSLILVAKGVEEVAGFVKGMEWQAPRPLPTDYPQGAPEPPREIPVSTETPVHIRHGLLP